MVKSAEITRLADFAIGSSIHQLWGTISQQLGFIVTQGGPLVMQTESTARLAFIVHLTQHDA